MNPFIEILSGLKNWMYEAMQRGLASFPIAGATGLRYSNYKLDELNAHKSKRVMRKERGSQPEHVGARRIDRNKTIHMKRFRPNDRPHCNSNKVAA